MAEGSGRVVYAALLGNVLVAASKFGAAFLSGSSAMLTEAVHSSADCTNQVLLLIGGRRGKLPPDQTHPFGYGMEIYFWTFVVAMLVLLAGGAFSIMQGLGELAHPELIRTPRLNLLVLGVSTLFEGGSFIIGLREARRVVDAHPLPGLSTNLARFISWSKDPNLFETLLEDGAALIGILIAAAGTVANAYFGQLRADGLASLLIGALLIANGITILVATRSLIAGEAVAPTLLHDLRLAIRDHRWAQCVSDLSTLHLGPDRILVALSIDPGEGEALDRKVADELAAMVKAVDDRITEVVFRFTRGRPAGSVKP